MSTQAYGRFAALYDIIYGDEKFRSESAALNTLLKRYSRRQVRSALDLGCGTGRHAAVLSRRGMRVTGVDLSAGMIEQARRNNRGNLNRFLVADVAGIRLRERFDAAYAMFHVLSYQTTNSAAQSFLRSVHRHLRPGGIFVADYWSGYGVVSMGRLKGLRRFSAQGMRIERRSETKVDFATQNGRLRYDFRVKRKGMPVERFSEVHRLRFYFPNEIRSLAESCGFEVVRMSAGVGTGTAVTADGLYAAVVLRRI